jgi:hypothetical protein
MRRLMGIPNAKDTLPDPPEDEDTGHSEEDGLIIPPFFNLPATSPSNTKIQSAAIKIIWQQQVSLITILTYCLNPTERTIDAIGTGRYSFHIEASSRGGKDSFRWMER